MVDNLSSRADARLQRRLAPELDVFETAFADLRRRFDRMEDSPHKRALHTRLVTYQSVAAAWTTANLPTHAQRTALLECLVSLRDKLVELDAPQAMGTSKAMR